MVDRLQGVRGISALTAFGLLSRSVTGRVQGGLTKTGNSDVCQLLIQAAWHHRKPYGRHSDFGSARNCHTRGPSTWAGVANHASSSPCPLTNQHPISERRWFVALGDVVVVEAAFGFDASLTVVFAGVLAARHHQATASVDAWRIRRCADGRGGLAQGWKQQPATGMGRVDLPTGRSPDDGAVGQLSSQPTPNVSSKWCFRHRHPRFDAQVGPAGYGIV